MKPQNFLNPILHRFNSLFEATPSAIRPWRWAIVGVYLVVTAFMVYGAVNYFKMDMTLDSWFDGDDPAKIALDDFREQFGSDDGLYVVYHPVDGDVFSYKSLQLIHELEGELLSPPALKELEGRTHLKHIEKTTTLTNSRYQVVQGDDLISAKMVQKRVPESKEALEGLRQIASTQRSMVGALFSKDYEYGAFQIKTNFGAIRKGETESPATTDDLLGGVEDFEIDADLGFDATVTESAEKIEFLKTEIAEYVDFMADLRAVMNQPKYKDHFQFYPVGNASMMDFAMKSTAEAGVLMIIMLMIIVGLLWIFLKSLSAVVWPVLLIIVNLCWVLGATAWLGVDVTTLVSLTAMLMITAGVADSIHVMSTYLLNRQDGLDHEAAMTRTYRKTGIPILVTSITTMCGMLALSVTGMHQFVVFGVMSAAGVGMAWFLTWTLLPVCLDLWHPLSGQPSTERATPTNWFRWFFGVHWLQPLLNRIPGWVSPRPIPVALLFLASFALFAYGTSIVKVDTNMVELTEEGSELRVAYELVDEKMMGAQNLEVMLDLGETDALKDPVVLQAMDKLEQRLQQNYSHYVTKTFSLANIVKETNQVMNQDNPSFYRIPTDPTLTGQLVFLFSNANPEDRRLLVNDQFDKTHISVMLKNAGSYEYKEMFDQVTLDIEQIFAPLKQNYPDLKVTVTGSLAMMMKLSQDMAIAQKDSFVFVIVVISLLMILTLGSFQGGLISIIPNIIPAIFTFGMMGLLGVPLDGDTMVMAPVIIGLAVDDTVHFITHYRDALMQGRTPDQAVRDTLREVGQAITFTSLILGLGFGILAFSSYGGMSKLGIFGSTGIFVALLCDLFLLPALIYIFKPTMGTQTSGEPS